MNELFDTAAEGFQSLNSVTHAYQHFLIQIIL